MNISKAQIAALVLGYLKSEKLHSVVEEFIKCCPYFEGNHENIKMGKYFATRIAGISLVDFLEQYAVIYSIVQSRLEETNFYECYSRTTLIEQLTYLLDQELTNVATSTPQKNVTSEVETTPAYALPGNSSFMDSDNSIPKTPKKRNTSSRSRDRDAVCEVTEVLTQSLLENHELHEKIAETINMVRNTPEAGKNVPEEHISAGAAKEIDAVIKTVIERTEGDPVYNKLIDEIIGTTSYENPTNKKTVPFCTVTSNLNPEDPLSHNMPDPLDDHNDAAIRSIIEASHNTDPPPLRPPTSESESHHSSNQPETNGEVYVFDGSLDTFLKTSGATNPINSNTVYFNSGSSNFTGSVIVVPPAEAIPKQYYIVNNNQPLLKVNALTEEELMSCPTIIVNDEKSPSLENQKNPISKVKKGKNVKRIRAVKPKPVEHVPILPKSEETVPKFAEVVTVSLAQTAAHSENVARQASHVRNLDFSTPSCKAESEAPRAKSKTWDAALRKLVAGCVDKSPSPKRRYLKRPTNPRKKKTKQVDQVNEVVDEPETVENPEEKNMALEDREKIGLVTPVKDMIPKTPGGMLDPSSFHCTPFNAVIEEQLKGVDLDSITTPNIPITPGFALTPGDMLITNQRSTDYSTSSSYYQPSDSEQNKITMCQLIEECARLEKTSAQEDKSSNVKNNETEQSQVPDKNKKSETKKPNERLKKFNNNIIGKKNLSLIRHPTSPSSVSGSDSNSDSDETIENNDKTVLCNDDTVKKANNTATIKDIIDTVKVKSTLDEKQKDILNQLEVVRLRTVDQLKNTNTSKKTVKNNRKLPPKKPKTPKTTRKKITKKKEKKTEDTTDEESRKLVRGLAKRGIHLIPNKTPQKKIEIKESIPQDEDSVTFDHKIYDEFEIITHSDRRSKKKNVKHYDFSVLKKSMSANVFIEGLNKEVTRVMRWTNCDCLLDAKHIETSDEETDEEQSDFTNAAKGGKKRKTQFSDENNQQKRNKVYERSINLLHKMGVETFLDQVHGE